MKEKTLRIRAYNMVANAKRKGTLIPQPYSACGREAEAHHPDYEKPLEVIWVCKPHHRLIDSFKFSQLDTTKKTRIYESTVEGSRPLIL